MSIEAPALQDRRAGWSWQTIGAYVALTKPRIIELLLVTTLPTMIVAQRGLPPVWLMVATLAAERWRPAGRTPSTWWSTATSTD